MEQASGTRSLRAPQGDGQTLIEPPRDALPQVVAANREQMAHVDYDFQGRSLTELSSAARHALVEKAVAYTRQYRNVPDRLQRIGSHAPSPPPFILAGHQPQLFHPGVWYKNFVLGSLARQVGALPVHLLIDSDLCRSASIRVPTGAIEHPRIEVVSYDSPSAELPYEERGIHDFDALRSFGDRVASLIRPLIPDPIVTTLWPLTLNRNPQERNLGLRLAQGRHSLEETWQNETLELPQSAVCQLAEFHWFLAHVLAHLPRFWAAHNDALAAYRHVHHLRNRAHPVPDLAEIDGWLEAPFWIWSADDPRRLPLFAQQSGDELVITDREARTFRLSLSSDRDAATAVEQLIDLASHGVKVRTRALTTTLFARILLSDLFLHGIGGAKYDQVTDQIVRAFFGFEPSEFATVSATLRLPIANEAADATRDRSCSEQLRELRYHPERFVDWGQSSFAPRTPQKGAVPLRGAQSGDNLTTIDEIISTKRHWIATSKTHENARDRHVAIAAANEALQPYVADRRRAIESRCHELQERKRASAILQSREYSFCLYPRRHFETLL